MTNSRNGSSGIATHVGSCHCGKVRFEVELDASKGAARCNCSVCSKIANTGVIVKPGAFRLLAGEEALSQYEWGGRISQRYFCKHCGVHCFARGHLDVLGGEYVSVNCNCLDDADIASWNVLYWDGRHNNWAAGARPQPWPIFDTQ
ncbi:MAG: GFA family protein [Myxococcota bacterium]